MFFLYLQEPGDNMVDLNRNGVLRVGYMKQSLLCHLKSSHTRIDNE